MKYYILSLSLLVAISLNLTSCKKKKTQNKQQTEQTKTTENIFLKDVNPKEFKQIIDTEDVIILDVRTPQEVAKGNIKGSSMINYFDENFLDKLSLVNKSKTICIYCKSGGRSSKAAKILQENGFNKIYQLEGGLMAWENEGLPITEPTNTKDENVKAMSLDEFNKLIKTDKPVLVEFHTLWCAPCIKMASVMDEIEKEYKDKALVIRIDLDNSKEVSKAFKIKNVPMFVLFKNGKAQWKHNGIIAKEELTKHLK